MKNIFTVFRSTVFIFLLLLTNNLLGQITITDGNWNDPATWGGSVPVMGTNITISHNITLDGDVTVGNLTVNSGASLQLSSYNMTVDGITTNDGTIDDDDDGGTNTFHEIINNGAFTTTGTTGNREYRFNGDITNNATFTLTGGNSQCQFNNAGITILNNEPLNGNMRFATNATTGTCDINENVIIGAGSSTGNVILSGGVAIALGKTLTNDYTNGELWMATLSGAGSLENNQTIDYQSSTAPSIITLNNNINSTFRYGAGGTVRGETYHNVIFSGSGTTTSTLEENITVNGDLTIGANRTLDANNYNIEIQGNWINSGDFTAGTSTEVIFNGASVEQTLEGATTFII